MARIISSYLSSPDIKEKCVAGGKSFNCCLAERTKPGVSGFHGTLSRMENLKIVIYINISNFSERQNILQSLFLCRRYIETVKSLHGPLKSIEKQLKYMISLFSFLF